SQSRIAKMEAGDPSVSLDLLIRSLLILGTSRRELSRIISARSPVPAAQRGRQPRAAPTRLVFFARGRARLVGCSALFGSPPLPRTALVVLRTPGSASLTASAEGIRAVVLVPNKRALNLYDHEVVPIELANGSRLPVLREG